jgi:hypothetical protein
MVETATHSWSYAETITENMCVLFCRTAVSAPDTVAALDIAITAAITQNRFAAMDACRAMMISIKEEELGMRVTEMLSSALRKY